MVRHYQHLHRNLDYTVLEHFLEAALVHHPQSQCLPRHLHRRPTVEGDPFLPLHRVEVDRHYPSRLHRGHAIARMGHDLKEALVHHPRCQYRHHLHRQHQVLSPVTHKRLADLHRRHQLLARQAP